MIDKIKSKVTNPYLKNNFTIDSIANFFANLISGNEFVNNLEVKDMAEFNKVEVKENLSVKNEAKVENLSFKKLNSKVLSIADNDIVIEPETNIKLKNTNMAFKAKDLFEVITFMKYIVNICGSTLEKCDFNNLIKNHNSEQLMQIINIVHKKQEQEKDIEKKKENEKKIESEKKQEDEKKKDDEKKKEAEKKEAKKKEDVIKEKKTESTLPNKDDGLSYNFKESKSSLKLENEADINTINDDYSKFLDNPEISQSFNSYYYDIPTYFNQEFLG
jgi:hypothetical protein